MELETRIKRKYTRKVPVQEEVALDVIEPTIRVVDPTKVKGVFQRGDTVKIIGNSNGSVNKIGEIGIVITDLEKGENTVRVQVGDRVSQSNNTRIYEIEHYCTFTKEELEFKQKYFGCYIPTETLINTSPGNHTNTGSHIYKVVNITEKQVEIRQASVPTGFPNRYTIDDFNALLNSRSFRVVNVTPEIEERIGKFTNVVKAIDFKNDIKPNGLNIVSTFTIRGRNGAANITVGAGFTGNCQLTVIGSMASLITMSSDLPAQLKEIQNYSSRKLLLCDIRSEYLPQLETLISKEAFNTVTPYKSSNGSKMVICILDLRNIK